MPGKRPKVRTLRAPGKGATKPPDAKQMSPDPTVENAGCGIVGAAAILLRKKRATAAVSPRPLAVTALGASHPPSCTDENGKAWTAKTAKTSSRSMAWLSPQRVPITRLVGDPQAVEPARRPDSIGGVEVEAAAPKYLAVTPCSNLESRRPPECCTMRKWRSPSKLPLDRVSGDTPTVGLGCGAGAGCASPK